MGVWEREREGEEQRRRTRNTKPLTLPAHVPFLSITAVMHHCNRAASQAEGVRDVRVFTICVRPQ